MRVLAQAASETQGSPVVVAIALGLLLTAIVVCFLKGKPGMGIGALLAGILAIVGSIRLAKPNSWWARRYYEPDGRKIREARMRFSDESRRVFAGR